MLLAPGLAGAWGMLLVLVAAGGWALAVSDARLESRPVWAFVAIGAAFVVAVAVAPRGSHDLWSYVMYGRTVAVHHASPYVHAPRDYPRDPFVHLVGAGWRGTRSVYGPLFTGVSTVLSKLAGASVARARLAFQGLALLGVIAALALIWLQSRSVRAVAFVGLHPAVVTAIVNGGHNDALVGLAVVGGAVLIARRRYGVAGVVVGLGVLVKLSTGFGLLGLAVWAFARGRANAARFVAAAVLTTAVGYAFTGLISLRDVANASESTSRASLWSPVSSIDADAARVLAIGLVVVLACIGAHRFRDAPRPWLPIGVAFAAYLLAGAYVLPWYAAWVLPTLALARRSWIAVLVGVQSALLVGLYELSRQVAPGTVAGVARGVVVLGTAAAALAIYVVRLARPGSPTPALAEPG